MTLLSTSSSLDSRSDAEPIDPSIVPLLISTDTIAQYFSVALLTVLVYHSVITMDKEIRYFWSNPHSSVSIIYFANRYIGVLSAICNVTLGLFTESLARCLFSYWVGGFANVVTILLIDYILLIRVLALFHQDKRLSIILKTLLSLEACTGIGILIYDTLFEGVIIGSLAEGMTICGQSRFFRTLGTVSWVVPMAYGTILLVLALYKAAEYWKLSSGFKGFHLVRVLIQDQVMYYGFVIFCSACQIVENSVQGINPFLANVLAVAGSPTLLCILGGQLLINLKEAGERGANGGTNYSLSSVSDIDFGENDAVHEQGAGLERSTETEGSV